MGSNDWDWLAYLAALAIGIALIMVISIIVGIIWLTISAIVATHRYKQYLKQAEIDYQQIEDELGAGLEADEVLEAMFGAGVLTDEGFDNPFDWLNATAFGINLEEAP